MTAQTPFHTRHPSTLFPHYIHCAPILLCLPLTAQSRRGGSYAYLLTPCDICPVAQVPEPETYAMFMAGLGLMGFMARRRKNGQA